MMEEPFFILNEFMEKDLPELQNVLDAIKGSKLKHSERAVFLREFTNGMFIGYKKSKSKLVKKEASISDNRSMLEKRRQELLEKLKKIQREKNLEKPVIFSEVSKQPLTKAGFSDSSYKVTEPMLNANESKILTYLENSELDLDNNENLKLFVKNAAAKNNLAFSDELFDKIRYYLVRDLKNFGKISPLVEDKNITEISCNGSNVPVTVTYEGKPEIFTNIKFYSDEEISETIIKLSGHKATEDNPFINFKVKDFNGQATFKTEFTSPRFALVRTA